VYVTPPAAYSNMTANLARSISMGNFTSDLKIEAIKASIAKNQSTDILYQSVTVGVSPFEPDKFVILVFNSTMEPTFQPSSAPPSSEFIFIFIIFCFQLLFLHSVTHDLLKSAGRSMESVHRSQRRH
jgi:hypothetical protein